MKKISATLILCLALVYSSCLDIYQAPTKNDVIDDAFLLPTAKNDSLVHELAEFIVQSVADADAQLYLTRFATKDFVSEVTLSDGKDVLLDNYRKSFERSFIGNVVSIPLEIIKISSNTGFYDYLYPIYDESKNQYSLLFRLFDEESGINYHEYRLVKKEGQLYFNDIYSYVTGEHISETYRKIYLAGLPKNLLNKFLGLSANNQDMQWLYESTKAQQNGDFSSAYDHLEKVSGELRGQKIYHVLKVQVAAQLDESTYLNSLTELVEALPNDATTKLMMIDYHFLNDDYEKTIEILNDLEEITKDPFLNFVKGNISLKLNVIDEAEKYYDSVLQEFPGYVPALLNMAAVLSHQNKITNCIKVLNEVLALDPYLYKDELLEYLEEMNKENNLFENLTNSSTFNAWKSKS